MKPNMLLAGSMCRPALTKGVSSKQRFSMVVFCPAPMPVKCEQLARAVASPPTSHSCPFQPALCCKIVPLLSEEETKVPTCSWPDKNRWFLPGPSQKNPLSVRMCACTMPAQPRLLQGPTRFLSPLPSAAPCPGRASLCCPLQATSSVPCVPPVTQNPFLPCCGGSFLCRMPLACHSL